MARMDRTCEQPVTDPVGLVSNLRRRESCDMRSRERFLQFRRFRQRFLSRNETQHDMHRLPEKSHRITAEAKILRGPHEDLESYLEAIDQLRANVRFFSSKKSFKSSDGIIHHANSLLAKALSKLEDEFRHLLTNYRSNCCFPGKRLSDQIFDGVESLKTQCFAEVTASSVAMLLSFGVAIAKSKRSPEKLFVLLDMYEIMRELQPEIETLFESKACTEMWEASMCLAKQLAQTVQETFVDFEEAVEKDATKTAVLDGTVHPLTSCDQLCEISL